MDLIEYARCIPKAELHVHLEGSIRPATLLQLAERNGLALPAHNEIELQDFYLFHDFEHFIQVYEAITACLRTPDDYRLIAYEFGAECARLNVRYAEATFSIGTSVRLTGLPWETVLESLNAGREQARQEFGVEIRWIFDVVRNLPETQETVLEIALAARNRGCVALGLGGSEADFPGQLFERTFEQAHNTGLPCVPHAGETAGPESVWQALEGLHADRIQHGVRAADDPLLVVELANRQIALDICLTSNIRLGIYPEFSAHPLRRLWKDGVRITIGSDDPPMFNTDLNQEYRILVEHFDFEASDLEQVSLNGLRASMLPKAQKARLEAGFQDEFARLRQELG